MKKVFLIIVLLMLLNFISGCINEKGVFEKAGIGMGTIKKYSPALGCIEYEGGAGPIGGCSGISAILDLEVDPKIDCLFIRENNCNGGILEIRNSCNTLFIFAGVEIKPNESVGLDILKKEGNKYLLTYSNGNFARYTPQNDEKIEVFGLLNENSIKVSFTKTKELC